MRLKYFIRSTYITICGESSTSFISSYEKNCVRRTRINQGQNTLISSMTDLSNRTCPISDLRLNAKESYLVCLEVILPKILCTSEIALWHRAIWVSLVRMFVGWDSTFSWANRFMKPWKAKISFSKFESRSSTVILFSILKTFSLTWRQVSEWLSEPE